MTDAERDQIRAAARASWDHARAALGLPPQITDPRILEQIAAIIRAPAGRDQEAA